jgi:predicted short-subunit dehydrogenase-like oxidoreductase (DUF2520 family)
MDIVILGSGNAAAVMGRKFHNAGHRIVQVWSRHASSASKLAYEWDTESTNYISLLSQSADVYLIAVSDNAIPELAANLRLPGKVVAHTAASVPASALASITDHYGVLYPLQSLRKENSRLPDIPIYFDGADSFARTRLQQLASTVSFDAPQLADDEQRMRLHVAAVLVNNFVNHLYFLAEQYCRRQGIDFGQLYPLIEETAVRLKSMSPAMAQTGPAIRHDAETIRKHLDMLSEWPDLKNVYLLMTESIQAGRAGV